jgi:class 3 adenylate cyclase
MRSESRAVMLTDMKGFTAATIRQTRDENARMLALHDALLMPVVKAFGGLRVKTIGDAYLVLFGAPTEALLCGMAIQDRLWDYGQRVAEAERMEVRVAVSFGEIRIVKDGGGVDVFGEAVNLAARVEGEALPGDVWFTEAVYWVADRRRVPFESIGYRELKGLPEKVRLFRVARTVVGGGSEPLAAPYGNAGLALVKWLTPPDPEGMARTREVTRPASGWRARLLGRALLLALLLAGAASAGFWFHLPRAERLIRMGRYDEARAALHALALQQGADSPQVLFLRGRVELAGAGAARGESSRTAFQLWSRALAAGSEEALSALEREAGANDCGRRRLATRALADAHSKAALRALEHIAAEEPPPAEPETAPGGAMRLHGDEQCGTGDLARQGLRALLP